MTHDTAKKTKPGVGLTEIAIIKKVSLMTVNRHYKDFDYIPHTKPKRFVLNDKILNWLPEYEKGIQNSKLKSKKVF